MEPLGSVTIFLIISCLLLFVISSRGKRYEKLPPGPTPLPIVGNLLQLKINNLDKTLCKLSEKYGPVVTLYFGAERVVALFGYETIKEALIDRGNEFASRGNLPLFDNVKKGQGIVFSNGDRWKKLRRFTLTTLRDFGMGKRSNEERIQEEAQCLLEKLWDTQGKPFDPTFLLSCALSNVICAIVFGNRYDYDDKKFLQMMKLINDAFAILSSPWGQLYNFFPSFMDALPGPHQRFQKCDTAMKECVLEHIKQHRTSLDPSTPRDFIDCFLLKMDQEEQSGTSEFTIDNLLVSTVDLFFAGTESSSSTLRYGLLILLKYPEVEDKVHEEIDRVIGRTRRPCLADRGQMPYTDAVAHEIQRFISLAALGAPHAVTKDTAFQQYIIPKGTTVHFVLTSLLHNNKGFANPQEFDPHHFLNEDGTFKRSDYFMPFSAGKRICVGEGLARAEIFLFFTTILQNFTLKAVKPREAIDLSPLFSSVGNVPRPYQLCVFPR